MKLKPLVLAAIGGGLLLQGCGAPPPRVLAMQPVMRVNQDNQIASWNRLGRFHHERGQLALALGAYAQSLSLDANQLEARNAVAVIEAQQGHLEDARKALIALVNDYPGEAQPHTNLGYVQYLMGDKVAAAQTLRRAMALGAGPKAFQNLQLAESAAAPEAMPSAPQQPMIASGAPATDSSAAVGSIQTARATPSTAVPAAPPAPTAAVTQVVALAAPTPATSAPVPEPYVPRAPKPTMAIVDPLQIASRMELVQLSPNVFELKQRVAAAPTLAAPAVPTPAPASTPAAAKLISASVAQPAPAAPQAVLAAMPKANKVQMARLEVSNGNGVTGMAKRFRSMLGQMGIPVDRLSNDKPYRQLATTIQYSPGFEKEAVSLQKALQGKAQLSSKQLQASDVRLVLGKDAQQSLTAATEAAGLSLVALNDDNN